jgi:hypothetical protein
VPLWLVTHVGLHRTAKVQGFISLLKEEIRAIEWNITGTAQFYGVHHTRALVGLWAADDGHLETCSDPYLLAPTNDLHRSTGLFSNDFGLTSRCRY